MKASQIKTQKMNCRFSDKGKIFNGMKLSISKSPTEGLDLFKSIGVISWDMKEGKYILKFCGQPIAEIDDNVLTINPQWYIHRRVEVFKTLNKLIRFFADGFFIKMVNMKWHLCQEIREVTINES